MRRFATGLAVLAAAGVVAAQPPTGGAKPITSVYGHDLRVRPGGKKDWKDAPPFGVDVYHDAANGCLLAVTEVGAIAAAPFTAPGPKKEAEWAYGFDLRVRKADAETFVNARRFGVEAFKDLGAGKLLYATEARAVAFAALPAAPAGEKEATFHHGLVLSVRDAKQQEWTNARKFGAEAFLDGNTGGLLYLTETGSVAAAAAPAAAAPPDTPKAPAWVHGMVLRVRKADEEDFTPQTRNLEVEVYSDPNSGALLFISDAGALAAGPAAGAVKPGQNPVWKGAFKVRARKAGEKEFDKAAKFGVEVFEDPATGYLVYASETGSIAVVGKR